MGGVMPKQQPEPDNLVRNDDGSIPFVILHDDRLILEGTMDGSETFERMTRYACAGCRVFVGGRELRQFKWLAETYRERLTVG